MRSSSSSHLIVVLVTCPSLRVGRRLAQAVVLRRAAACVNILPRAESVFWWQGKIERAGETLLVIKTTARHFEALRTLLCRLHPYDVPEVIALPIRYTHPPYRRWVQASVRR